MAAAAHASARRAGSAARAAAAARLVPEWAPRPLPLGVAPLAEGRSRALDGQPRHAVGTGFVAVGTNAALKFVDHRDADAAGLFMLANTFHLLVHPGPDVVAAAGGLHNYGS